MIFRRLANLAAGNDNVEIVENENTEIFYVKINSQLGDGQRRSGCFRIVSNAVI